MKFIDSFVLLAVISISCHLYAGTGNRDTEATPKLNVSYAKNFTINYKGNCKLVKITKLNQNTQAKKCYCLVPRGVEPTVPIPENAEVIRTPIKSAVIMSTTYIPFFSKLGIIDCIVGIENGRYVYSPEIRSRVKAKKIIEVSAGRGGGINVEKLFHLKPDLIITYSTGNSQVDAYPKLKSAGIKIVFTSSYLEQTPLGRAEWIKFISLFFNKEKEADTIFKGIEQRYNRLKEKMIKVAKRPTVFSNASFKGTWHVPCGGSFPAALFKDAGANYLWKDQPGTGSLPVDFEVVLNKAKNADFWINPGAASSLKDLLKIDERYAIFESFKKHNVFNNNRRISFSGGNDYWESGNANPDLVLADLVKIFHPELMKSHKFMYYKRLE